MRDLGQPVLRAAGGLVVRPWRAADAPVVLEAYRDPAIQQWNLRAFGSLEEAGDWIGQWGGRWRAERDGCWAVDELGLHRLFLLHSTANPASCRVAARAGFALEGTLRSAMRHPDGWHDMHLHGLVPGDASTRTQGARARSWEGRPRPVRNPWRQLR